MNKELIKMAHAHVNQHTSGANKTSWMIRGNYTEELLGELPNKLNEKEVFYILDLIRKYELDAFNIGIDFGKNKSNEHYKPLVTQLEENIKRARFENERLADVLDKEQNKVLTLKNK